LNTFNLATDSSFVNTGRGTGRPIGTWHDPIQIRLLNAIHQIEILVIKDLFPRIILRQRLL
jgi:hypothetical protein